MTIQQHKIDMIRDGTGQMVSKVSKLFKRKKKPMYLVGLWLVDEFLEMLNMYHKATCHYHTAEPSPSVFFTFSPHKKGLRLMHVFNQVLPVLQIIQFPREATWNTCFHISKLHLLKTFIQENALLTLLYFSIKTSIRMSSFQKNLEQFSKQPSESSNSRTVFYTL